MMKIFVETLIRADTPGGVKISGAVSPIERRVGLACAVAK